MRDPRPKLICRNVWKLFGDHAARLLAETGGAPELAQIAEAGLVSAVRAVDLEVRESEIFVIMGLSGSGKSTLVRCMSRLVEPTAGEILFDGKNLLSATDAQMIDIRRHRMGMVFQHFALLPHMTVLDNVAFPLEVQGIARPVREERARGMIALVGLSGREDAYPRQLSGGQQQRVGIARSPSEGLRILGGVTYWGDNRKAKRFLGYSPRPLKEGLESTLRHEMTLLGME
jgi:glycine betaine/proline transport system ATP-binding protein